MSQKTAAGETKTKSRRGWQRLLPLIGAALLVVVLAKLDHKALAAAVARFSPGMVVAAMALFLANVVVKGIRWRRLLVGQEIVLPWRAALLAFFGGAFYGSVTIGRVGELLRAKALTQRGVPLGVALASCVFDRLLDLLVLIVLGGVVGAYVFVDSRLALAVGAVLCFSLPTGLILILKLEPVIRAWSQRSRRRWLRRSLSGALDIVTSSRCFLRFPVLSEALAWSTVGWCGYFGAVVVLASDLGISVSVLTLVAATSFAALSTLIPVTFQGLGTRELVFAFALAPYGVEPESAVALALASLGVIMTTTTVFGGAGVLLETRLRGSQS